MSNEKSSFSINPELKAHIIQSKSFKGKTLSRLIKFFKQYHLNGCAQFFENWKQKDWERRRDRYKSAEKTNQLGLKKIKIVHNELANEVEEQKRLRRKRIFSPQKENPIGINLFEIEKNQTNRQFIKSRLKQLGSGKKLIRDMLEHDLSQVDFFIEEENKIISVYKKGSEIIYRVKSGATEREITEKEYRDEILIAYLSPSQIQQYRRNCK